MKMVTLRPLASMFILLLFIGTLSSIAIAGTAPPIPPEATPVPPSPPSGGGGYYSPPVATPTPTPTPTPVPPYRLSPTLPLKVIIGGISVSIDGDRVSVPMGYLIQEVIKNNTIEAPITMNDGGTARLVITVEPSGSQTGAIMSMHLIAEKTLNNSGHEVHVTVDISLAGLPAGSSLDFDLLDPDSVDIDQVNGQLSAYRDMSFVPAPLLVIKALKNGLANGKDILGATFTFTVPRPAGFDPSADYYVIRQSDGMMEVLNATLVGSPDADPLTYEVVSPHGLSTFSLVKAESSTVAPTAVPTAMPSPTPAPEGGLSGYLVAFGTFVVGIVAGMATLALVLWLRVR